MVMVCSAACSSGGNGDGDGGNGDGDGGSWPDELIGTFQVALMPPAEGNPAYTKVFGMVFDGPTPVPLVWEEAARDGACRLMTPRVPYCEEPCEGGAICVEDNVCQFYPETVTVGTVEVEGLRISGGGTSFSMDPIAGNYQPTGITLEYPGFFEGDAITVSAEGEDQVPAFTLEGEGIAELELLNQSIELADGQAVNLSWTPPGQDVADIYVKLDISHHGGTKGMIECDVEDTGSLELTAAMLDQLKSLGISGWPSIVVTRWTAGSTKVPLGRIDLSIVSSLEMFVEIPGLVSCLEDADCPTGQTCQDDLKCE
jgi:hypothetical protein